MDGDEAAMLLAEMDAPLEENDDDKTMDDDEAAIFLANGYYMKKKVPLTMDDDEAAMYHKWMHHLKKKWLTQPWMMTKRQCFFEKWSPLERKDKHNHG